MFASSFVKLLTAPDDASTSVSAVFRFFFVFSLVIIIVVVDGESSTAAAAVVVVVVVVVAKEKKAVMFFCCCMDAVHRVEVGGLVLYELKVYSSPLERESSAKDNKALSQVEEVTYFLFVLFWHSEKNALKIQIIHI